MNKIDFHPLIEQIKNGDERAFEELYKVCSRYLAFVCSKFCNNRQDVEEIVQDVMVIIHSKANELRADTILAYMRKIAVNECYRKASETKSYLQHVDYSASQETVEAQMEFNEDFLPEEYVTNNEKRAEFLKVLQKLPKMQWESVYMYFYSRFTVAEIAKLHNCSESNVYNNLARAKKALQAKFTPDGKIIDKKNALVPLGVLLLAEEQALVATYTAGATSAAGAGAVTATSKAGHVIATCIVGFVAACAIAVGVYISAQTNYEHYITEPAIAAIVEAITTEPPTTEPVTEPPTTEAVTEPPTTEPVTEPPTTEAVTEPLTTEPIAEPINRTLQILAALSNATTPGCVADIIYYYDFEFFGLIQSTAYEQFRFYVTNEGSGDILIGIVVHEDDANWRINFRLFEDIEMPQRTMDLFRFME